MHEMSLREEINIMEDNKLTNEMLENVTGGGTVPTEPAYKTGTRVRFHYNGKVDTGVIEAQVFYASTKTWSYHIYGYGISRKCLVPEADIEGPVS